MYFTNKKQLTKHNEKEFNYSKKMEVIKSELSIKEWILKYGRIIGLLVILLILATGAKAQTDSICLQRGHVNKGCYMITDAYCPPYLIESDTATIQVHPSCNEINYNCMRCKKNVTEKEKENRIVIWRKGK